MHLQSFGYFLITKTFYIYLIIFHSIQVIYSEWLLEFSDEFNGKTLDLRKWSVIKHECEFLLFLNYSLYINYEMNAQDLDSFINKF
jgi:hypothetical protein